jgi:hypothetical protein
MNCSADRDSEKARTSTLGDFSVKSKPMAFRCEFDNDGRSIAARLE